MDTFDPDERGRALRRGRARGGGGREPARVHYSTGRLTRAQAGLVNAWRARLREDKPVPGQPRAGEARRPPGASGRPRASCSDAIAAAVAGLLASQPPAPLELARYAYASMRAQQAARTGRGAGEAAPLYPPARTCPPASPGKPSSCAAPRTAPCSRPATG